MPEPVSAPAAAPPVVVKKYANRRLYNTETSSYITLDNLAEMIRAGRDFVVYDAKSSEDITRGVLTQIIVEEESKGTSMLPTAFLRQLVGFYGGSLSTTMPGYLETAMASFSRQQAQLREAMQQTLTPFLPASVGEMSRQNLAAIERALSLFNPFHRGSEPLPPAPSEPSEPDEVSGQATGQHEEAPEPLPAVHADLAELERLRHEVESLRVQLAAARAEAVVLHAPHPAPHAIPPVAPPPNILADVAPVLPAAPPLPALAAYRETRSRKPQAKKPVR